MFYSMESLSEISAAASNSSSAVVVGCSGGAISSTGSPSMSSRRLRLVEKQLVDLSLKNGRFCLRESSIHRGREIFVSWYTLRAQQWFEKQVSEHASRMGSNVKQVKVQDLGFRWGSFGAEERVSLHWKAILLPPRIAEYVIVHELAHAHHPDHSANFWIKVEQQLPDWRRRKTWLGRTCRRL
jgi:hypothetical protein